MFQKSGYSRTSVDAFIQQMGVAKDTFYEYFKTKAEVLSAIVGHTLDAVVKRRAVANDASLDALSKMRLLLAGTHMCDDETLAVFDLLHLPENRELHEVSNV